MNKLYITLLKVTPLLALKSRFLMDWTYLAMYIFISKDELKEVFTNISILYKHVRTGYSTYAQNIYQVKTKVLQWKNKLLVKQAS